MTACNESNSHSSGIGARHRSRRVYRAATNAREPGSTKVTPFKIEHHIAFETTPPCYSLRLSVSEPSQGFTQVFDFRLEDASVDGQDQYEKEVKALTDYFTSHYVEDTIKIILGPFSVD